MNIGQEFHLTYCSNIHPANTWSEVFQNLKTFLPAVKRKLNHSAPFGVGLYLSNKASLQILQDNNLTEFKTWLDENGFYVFTMNGFPYGNFHEDVIKDNVYRPDWTMSERVKYTKRLFEILLFLLPNNLNGGVSTSPLAYKYWSKKDQDLDHIYQKSTLNLADIAAFLHQIYQETGKTLHLDIEPEPDCLLETSDEVIDFFNNWLLPVGSRHIANQLQVDNDAAQQIIRKHINVCYDICHFAVEYEQPETVINKLAKHNITIGKIQISAALKANFSTADNAIITEFQKLHEPKYLHQMVIKEASGKLCRYRDLVDAIVANNTENNEWRTHFHVPVFMKDYGQLQSTQDDILTVLNILKQKKITSHLEVETYTWEVLPDKFKTELTDSIVRELAWVIKHFHE
jgi:hypothetical protein